MKCPNCLVFFHSDEQEKDLGEDIDSSWHVVWCKCPTCEKFIIWLKGYRSIHGTSYRFTLPRHPKITSRQPLPPEVPQEYAKDYKEASLILVDSPNASAAISRRCLQSILRGKGNVKKSNLNNEIEEVISSNALPSYLSESLDAVRNIGNFAAHPTKSNYTGEIIEVEEGEAEWNLDVLESLFDFYFIQPKKLNEKKNKLNEKLKDAGKPEMK